MKNFITQALCLCLLLIGGYTAQAQLSNSFNDVLTIQMKDMGPIYENNVVKGYYMFYDLDKVDRKNRSFLLKILDENTREVASTIITKPKGYGLLEAKFNGEAILFVFVDPKKKITELVTMNKKAEILGEKILEKGVIWGYPGQELAPIAMQMPHLMGVESSYKGTTFAIKNKGFGKINYSKSRGKQIYEIEFIPNDLSTGQGWVNRPNSRTPMHHVANLLNVTDNFLFLSTMRKQGIIKGDLGSTVKMVNLKNGRTVFEKKLYDKRYRLSLLNCFFDEEKEETLILGRYFKKDDTTPFLQGNAMIKGNATLGLGIYTIKVNRAGEVINKKFISWEDDLAKFIEMNKKGNMKDQHRVFTFYDSVIFPDGRFFIISEAKRGNGSLRDIMMAATGYQMYNMDQASDFYIFEFSPEFSLSNVYTWDIGKQRNREKESGKNQTSKEDLSAFFYKFTEQSADKKSFFSTYVAIEKKKGQKQQTILGIIAGSEEGFSEDKIPLTTEASRISLLPAKPGYVLLAEYFEKEKRLDMRLEKFNY